MTGGKATRVMSRLGSSILCLLALSILRISPVNAELMKADSFHRALDVPAGSIYVPNTVEVTQYGNAFTFKDGDGSAGDPFVLPKGGPSVKHTLLGDVLGEGGDGQTEGPKIEIIVNSTDDDLNLNQEGRRWLAERTLAEGNIMVSADGDTWQWVFNLRCATTGQIEASTDEINWTATIGAGPTHQLKFKIAGQGTSSRYYKCIDQERPPAGGRGDPHFKTWHGHNFDFHGECDLVLLHSPLFESGKGLDVHIRTTIKHGYSYISGAVLKIGSDVLEVGGRSSYYWNGVEHADLPDNIAGFGLTNSLSEKKRQIFELDLAHRGKIRIAEFKDFLSVSFGQGKPEHYEGSTGLMGSFHTGEMLARDGETVMDDQNAFGQEWQVLDTEPMLFQTTRAPQSPQTCIMPNIAKQSRHRRLGATGVTPVEAERACAHWGADKDACIFDVMATGDLEMADAGSF